MEKIKIHCIDDDHTQLRIYEKFLTREFYQVETSQDPKDALEKIKENKPDLILLDIEMPGMNGIELLRKLKENILLSSIQVLMVSGNLDANSVVKSFQFGAADYLRKPFYKEELIARVRQQLDNLISRRQYQKQIDNLKGQIMLMMDEVHDLHDATIFSLAKLAESRDPETGAHLERIREYTKALAENLAIHKDYSAIINEEFIDNIYHMSAIHDIGKVGIPDHILLKPGIFTKNEKIIMEKHTVIGGEALDATCKLNPNTTFLLMGRDIAYYHHERWDGTGYPFCLKEEEIPIAARITTIADVYDALNSRRVYRDRSYTKKQLHEFMDNQVSMMFDPFIYQQFLAIEDQFDQIKKKYSD
ncbi:MAG: response regulator [Spirochaetes bacterium]|nr:response regulator [Spirochaetota bacterium]